MKLTIESTIVPNNQIRKNRYNTAIAESLRSFEIGKTYPDFDMIEPFIQEYDIALSDVHVGDIIVRDWQFGHLKNTGYKPQEVVDITNHNIVVSNNNGYNDRIFVDTIITKDTVYHKLNKNYLNIEEWSICLN